MLTDAEREAVKLFAKHEGLLLDPVYTGTRRGRDDRFDPQGIFQEGRNSLVLAHRVDSLRCLRRSTQTRFDLKMISHREPGH